MEFAINKDKVWSVSYTHLAVAKGYSILEINYRPITSGKFAGKIGIASVKSKDPALFGFELDDFLNITGLFLQRDGNKTKLPRSKFIVDVYKRQKAHGCKQDRYDYTYSCTW